MSGTVSYGWTSASSRRVQFPSRLVLLAATLGLFLLGMGGRAMAAPPTEVTGELDVIIKEDFNRGHFEQDYFLRGDDGETWYQLEFERTPPGHLRSGQRLRIRGVPQGKRFRVEGLEESGSVTSATNTALSGLEAVSLDDRTSVVLMVNLTNASVAQTRDQIIGNMFTNTRSVDKLYREASLGQLGFPADTNGDIQPDVFGPFTIAYDNSTCNYYDWAYAAEAAAQAAGVDFSLYQHRVFVLPQKSSLPACSWSGIANVGCGTFCRAWIAGSTGMIFAHELGHNLNMAHAGNDPENDGTINNVYGDTSDPMGSSSSSWYLFNAGHLDQMGWYANIPGAIGTVLTSGVYDIAAIGLDPATAGAPMALKIVKADSGEFYYLSYRQPIGNFNQLAITYTQGVSIHRYKGSGYGYTSYIKTLVNGGVFSDSLNGINVQQLSKDSDSVTVQVSFGCGALTPTLALTPTTSTLKPGNVASFSVTLTNNDSGCTATPFSLTSSLTGGSLAPASLLLAAGQSGVATLTISGLPEGIHTVTVTATDNDGVAPHHAGSGQGSATVILDGTPPTTPNGLVGTAQQGRITLSWSAATDTLSTVTGYRVYRNGTLIGQPSSITFSDANVTAGVTYQYAVSAGDGAGNVSQTSNPISVKALSKAGKK